jgi:hypothetical protein
MVLKGYLKWHDQPFRKTHNLMELVEQCFVPDESFAAPRTTADRLAAYATGLAIRIWGWAQRRGRHGRCQTRIRSD